jgi:glyoxylate reductase
MKDQRIFATCDIGEEALQRVRDAGYDLEVWPEPEAPPREVLLDRVRSGIVGLISTLRDRIDEELLQAGAGTLRVIAQDAVGFDNVDRQAANRYRIPFTHTPDVLTEATAELAFFLMGSAARKLYPSEKLVRDGEWRVWHPWLPFLGDQVTGKTVAVVGAGRIGRAFALKCAGFGMSVLCVEQEVNHEFAKQVQHLLDLLTSPVLGRKRHTIRYCDLEEALEAADFASLHVPLTDETRFMINEQALRRMKPSAYLINTSRGAVVDEKALVRALRENWIAGAALDVFETEPLPPDSPLLDPALGDRLRLAHHIGSGTQETRLSPDPDVGMAGRCVQGLLDVLQGRYEGDPRKMPFVVNKEAFENQG